MLIAALALGACGISSPVIEDTFKSDTVSIIAGKLPFYENDRRFVFRTSSVNLIPKSSREGALLAGAAHAFQSGDEIPLLNMLNTETAASSVRVSKPDDTGRFNYGKVPPGEYFLVAIVSWCREADVACRPVGKRLFLREVEKDKERDLFVEFP